MPLGEYYIYESAYPPSNNTDFTYTNSSLNNYVNITPDGETLTYETIKVNVSSSNATNKSIFNKPKETAYGSFTGGKKGISFDENGNKITKNLAGAEIGIFDTYDKAASGTKSQALRTTTTDKNGKYYFSLKGLTQHQTYYFAEIQD